MVGFCFAIPGVKTGGRPYLHSHMLGVLPKYHNAGIGRRLKLRQREEALGRGITLIEWTFDPLELKNAYWATAAGYEQLLGWLRSFGTLEAVGVPDLGPDDPPEDAAWRVLARGGPVRLEGATDGDGDGGRGLRRRGDQARHASGPLTHHFGVVRPFRYQDASERM